MDPWLIKLWFSAALISLVELGSVPAWVAWTILGREFAVTGLRAIVSADGVVLSASKLGKIKTVTQVISISAILLHDWPFSLIGIPVGQPVLYIALFFTIISGVDYFLKTLKHLRK